MTCSSVSIRGVLNDNQQIVLICEEDDKAINQNQLLYVDLQIQTWGHILNDDGPHL